MSKNIVKMKNITKIFPGTKALDEVNFELESGEIHALVGENGAGKSTLMNILTGQILKDKGDVYLFDEKIELTAPKDSLNQGIVLVPQEINLIPDGTIAENIFLGNEITKNKIIDKEKMITKSAEILGYLNIEIDVNQKVKNISAAYKQLVSIARALIYEPKVLILDEPTAVLTVKEKTSLFSVMDRMKQDGTAIIFITHQLDEVIENADRVTIMRDGRVVGVKQISSVTKDDLITAMAGKEIAKTKKIKRNYSQDVFYQVENISRENEFQNISFKVHKGEILGIAGLVGAGRTEIFQTVFGITLSDTVSKVMVEGKEVKINSPKDAIKCGMGYVSEERREDGIIPLLSVLENMTLPAWNKITKLGLIDFASAEKMTSQYIESFSIKTPSSETLISNLSGGNQQKVILARWLLTSTKMLILDEPTRGIDVNAKGEIHNIIQKLADQGVSVIVISSEMEEILSLSDRIIVIGNGKIKGEINDVMSATEESILQLIFQ